VRFLFAGNITKWERKCVAKVGHAEARETKIMNKGFINFLAKKIKKVSTYKLQTRTGIIGIVGAGILNYLANEFQSERRFLIGLSGLFLFGMGLSFGLISLFRQEVFIFPNVTIIKGEIAKIAGGFLAFSCGCLMLLILFTIFES
jgi:hypothetical protein